MTVVRSFTQTEAVIDEKLKVKHILLLPSPPLTLNTHDYTNIIHYFQKFSKYIFQGKNIFFKYPESLIHTFPTC